MDILLTSSNEYFKPMLILINSIFDSNNDIDLITIHVVHTALEEENVKILKGFIEKRGGILKEYRVDMNDLKNIYTQSRMSLAPFLRLYAIYVLKDIDKILYMDIDMIVVKSLKEVWDTDMEDYYIAAIGNAELYTSANLDSVKYISRLTQHGVYYNSGFMIMRLDRLRNDISLNSLIQYIKKNEIRANGLEEIIINLLWNKKIKSLEHKYNSMAVRHNLFPRIPSFNPEKTVVWHYMFETKPWLRYEFLQDNIIEMWALEEYEKYSNIPECFEIHQEVVKNMCFLNKGRCLCGYSDMLQYFYYFKSHGVTTEKFFNDNNYKNIAVYGTGTIAKAFCDEIEECEIDIKYFIRTREGDGEYRGKKVIAAEKILNEEKVDAIVVTTYKEYEGIKAYLKYLGVDIDVISFEEIVYWI